MVNEVRPADAAAAERALALSYAPADRRPALTALFALDDRLRVITRAAREPMIGVMKLTWWREALERLDIAPAPAEPLLRGLAAEVLPRGVDGAALATLVEPWDRMLDGDVDWDSVARERGERLFGLAARLLGAEDARVAIVASGWAAVDLARDWPEARQAVSLGAAYRARWPRALRPLGALGLLARSDLDAINPAGSPRRVARLLAHRLTGR